jgi:hypothetical protein
VVRSEKRVNERYYSRKFKDSIFTRSKKRKGISKFDETVVRNHNVVNCEFDGATFESKMGN